jgi:lipopolysaccharide export system protein LptA
MPLPIYRLRRLLALTAVVFIAAVLGVYFYARSRIRDVTHEVGNKLGIEIKQTANGFQFSKSDGKRTLFTVQASKVKEFKLNGRAELHNVNIVLYGRDSSRFDQIYGDDFAYDPQTGDITAKGEVQIDLVANPAGLTSPDQSMPKELKNPIHLKTRDLVFNRESGNASTDARVDFRTAQATGSAVGVRYAGKSNTLTLSSQVHLIVNGTKKTVIDAQHGVITNDPRLITLDAPHLNRDNGTMTSERAVLFLNAENQVVRALCTGNVTTNTRMSPKGSPSNAESTQDKSEQTSESEIHGHAEQAEFLLGGKRDELHTAILTGNVHFEQIGAQPMQGDAGRVVVDFAAGNQVQTVHAREGAHLAQKASAAKKPDSTTQPQNFDLTAPAIDFTVAQGNVLQRAVTLGAAQITISPAQDATSASAVPTGSMQRTVVTADKFNAEFAMTDGRNHLTTMHGAPNARVVSTSLGQPERVSTSDAIDATFLPQGGIEAVTQQGNVVYADNQSPDKRTQAWGSRARYTPGDQVLMLTGNPRVSNGAMETTAKTIRINRATGDALADGDVKSTYSDLKEQPDGALLASSSPIHVTSKTMTAHNTPGVALYTGNARLWQDANVIEAPSIQFDRDRRFVTAQGTSSQPVKTILVQTEKVQTEKVQAENAEPNSLPSANTPAAAAQKNQSAGVTKSSNSTDSSPIAITAMKLIYADAERKAHYEGGVVAKNIDFDASAKTADVFLLPRSQTSTNQMVAGPGQLDHLVAQGDVVITQPNRRADGQKLVYTAATDQFVLTGGPPSIFDAEQGKITGVSLTFFKRDDRVLVEGEASTPVVTTTRVAR